MTIIRVKHDRDNPYFMMNRCAVNDDRLSFKAVGILTYLLSKPDNWSVQEADLARRHTDGTTAVRSGLNELKEFGYVCKVPIRNQQGVVLRWEDQVHESPNQTRITEIAVEEEHKAKKSADSLECGKPTLTENSDVGLQRCGFPARLISNGRLVSNEKKQVMMSEKSDSSLVPEETGFNFTEKREPEKKSASRIFAEKLHSSLSVKRKIFRPVDIKLWTKEIAKFIAESDLSVEEFEKVLDWYCDHVGEEFVSQAYSAKSFVEKFPYIVQQSQVFVVNRITSPVEILKEKWRNEYAAQQAANS